MEGKVKEENVKLAMDIQVYFMKKKIKKGNFLFKRRENGKKLLSRITKSFLYQKDIIG